MSVKTLALFFLIISRVATFAQGSKTFNPDDVGADQLGKTVAVQGRVHTTAESKSRIHLFFGADDTTAFQAIVMASELHNFKVDVRKKFGTRNVRVRGKVEEVEGNYFIRVKTSSQLKVVPRGRRRSRD